MSVRAPYAIGIDLGGTKIEVVVLSEDNSVIVRERCATEASQGAQHILARIEALYQEACRRIDHAPHTLGVGTPGSLSPLTGRLRNSNTVCLNGTPFKSDLESALGHPVVLENDANCFALAEATLGAGRGYHCVFGVILGTGCGGGWVWDQKLRRGPQAIAGEWGHMSLDATGPLCYCGRSGCVETFISGSGLESRYRHHTNESLSAEEIFKRAKDQDKTAQFWVEDWATHFGRALANVINCVDPDIVVMGGGLSNQESVYTLGVQELHHYIFSDEISIPVVKHQLGDSAGVIGAALLGRAS